MFDTVDTAMTFLEGRASDLQVMELCAPIFKDGRFKVWSGASKPHYHHYGKGGLCRHIAEVANLCILNNAAFANPIDRRELFVAAFFHDVGKMWDYQPVDDTFNDWKPHPHKRHIHHITRSVLVFSHAVAAIAHDDKQMRRTSIGWLGYDFEDNIIHAILSHHGRREVGSPVYPNNQLAHMLHLCDSMSARMDDTGRFDPYKE